MLKKTSLGFPTRSETNRPIQSHKVIEARNYRFKKKRDGTVGDYHEVKTKVLISSVVTAQMIWVVVFTYAKSGFS